MQSTQGSAWDRLTVDLASLAGANHRERQAEPFELADEHMHPASPPCWPRKQRHIYSADTRELLALERTIGAEVRATYVRRSPEFGVAALARRFDVAVSMIAVLLDGAPGATT
jgi:hypothetical protein